jgi:hypothetical protein
MQQAADDGDTALLDALLVSYDEPGAPEPYAGRLRGYRGVARGIEFQRHVAERARLVIMPGAEGDAPVAPDGTPYLGTPLLLELRVPPAAGAVRLGGERDDDPVGFSVAVTIEDEFVDGGSRSSQTPVWVPLPTAVELTGDTLLTLPVAIDAPAGAAVRRTVYVRIDLMPCYVSVATKDGRVRAPVRRTVADAGSWTQWPAGYDLLRKRPLDGLRAALADFRPGNFASAYLSALLVGPQDREQAIALLIDQVRFGGAGQAQVAMAALRRVTGVELPIGDRDAWLEWWQGRSGR